MNTLQQAVARYLDDTGESKRSLSLRSGLHEKAVADLLAVDGYRPRRAVIVALSAAMKRELPYEEAAEKITFAGLIRRIPQKVHDDARAQRLVQRLRWLVRQAGWVAEFEAVDRSKVMTFFAKRNAATFGISNRSFATYKAEVTAALDLAMPRARARMINDLTGSYAEVHVAVQNRADLATDLKNVSGSFLVFLNDRGIAPSDVTTATLDQYFQYRLAVSPKGESVARKHVKRTADLLRELASQPEFRHFGFGRADHPFSDGRNRYDVANDVVASIMSEFDHRIAPWAMGQISRAGECIDDFIAALDRQEPTEEDKKRALLRRSGIRARASEGGRSREASFSAHGFLLPKQRWSEKTLATRRGFIVAGVKALYARTGYLVETVEELTDPDVVWLIAVALVDANQTGFQSGYAASVVKAIIKVARDFQRRPEEDIVVLQGNAAALATPKGMSERNVAKLRAFTPERIPLFLSVTDRILDDVNHRTELRRLELKTKMKGLTAQKFTPDQCRDIMCALAQDLMLVRAPRSANILNIRLNWISWCGPKARIVVPSTEVKLRKEADPDLVLDLSIETSRLLRQFLDKVRPLALITGDEENPYLFPGQGNLPGRPYETLLQRLVNWVFDIVGAKIHPHLYRHLIGWIWLRDNIDMLPVVQQLLGHKNMQTTIDYYAAIDGSLAMQRWNEFLNGKRKQ